MHAHAPLKEKANVGEEKRKMREGKGENGASIWYSHYTSCRFHLHLIVCLIAGKKRVIYQAWRGSWSLFPWHGSLCCCLCLCMPCVSVCSVCVHVRSTSIQTTVAFACVQWPICEYELWQYLPKKKKKKRTEEREKKNSILTAEWLRVSHMCMDVWQWRPAVCVSLPQLPHHWPGLGPDGAPDAEAEPPRRRPHPALVCIVANHTVTNNDLHAVYVSWRIIGPF